MPKSRAPRSPNGSRPASTPPRRSGAMLGWRGKEGMPNGGYHRVMQGKLTGGFDANNNLTALHMRLSGQSILADVFPQTLDKGKDPMTFQGLMPAGTEHAFGYSVPNLMIHHAMRNPHIKPGFCRRVNVHQDAIL